jgi:hypothetical protein
MSQREPLAIRAAAREIVGFVVQAARFAASGSMRMQLWVLPGPRGTVARHTGLGSAAFDAMGAEQRSQLEAYLAALGFVAVEKPVEIKAADPAWGEFRVAVAIGEAVARWAVRRSQEARAANDVATLAELSETADCATREMRNATARATAVHDQLVAERAAEKAAAGIVEAAPAAAPPAEVLGDRDYDEHVRLVVREASGRTVAGAVRMLARAEALLWRRGRLTAERGAALVAAFAGVAERAADLRRN